MSDPSNSPVLVEVLRGPAVESRHRGAFAVTDAAGRVVAASGPIDSLVFPRSAVKPLQALPLVESGAAEAFGLTNKELALACASHRGESPHVGAVTAWLAASGLGPEALECAPCISARIRAATFSRAMPSNAGSAQRCPT
jgi:L-asparaginase II